MNLLSRHRKLYTGAILLAGFVILTLAYWRVGQTIPYNSDSASILLEAHAIARGNLLLSGWTLSTVPYLTTDLPPYVLAVVLDGLETAVLDYVPALLYPLVVGACVLLAGKGKSGKTRFLSMAATFLLVGLPSPYLAKDVLHVSHVVGLLFMLVSLGLIEHTEQPGNRRRVYAALAVLLFLATFGDSFALWFLILPLILVSGLRLVNGQAASVRQEVVLIGVGVWAAVVSKLLVRWIGTAGGFQMIDVPQAFAAVALVPGNVVLFVEGVLYQHWAYFFGRPLDLPTLMLLLHLPGALFVFGSLGRALSSRSPIPFGTSRVNDMLCIAMVINLATYILSNQAHEIRFVHPGVEDRTERFLVPFYLYGAILVGRVGVPALENWRPFRFFAPVLALVYMLSFVRFVQQPPVPSPALPLSRWLAARGLKYGYAGFWNASAVTVETKGAVRVRAVLAQQGVLTPFHWMSNESWYTDTPANFLVYDTFNWGEVNRQTAEKTFGKPDEVHSLGTHTVLVWRKNITPFLKNTP